MKFFYLKWFLLFLMAGFGAFAPWVAAAVEVQVQPTEIVEATPLDSFSERAAGWPSAELTNDTVKAVGENSFEILKKIPGFQVSVEGSPLISIRGSGSLSRTLLLYDGVPMNFGDGLGSSQLLIPAENISNINYIKGPASLFYGNEAMSGAVNFVPRISRRAILGLGVGGFESTRELAHDEFFLLPLATTDENQEQATIYREDTAGNFPYSASSRYGSGVRTHNDRHLTRETLTGRHRVGNLKVSDRFIFAQENDTTPGDVSSAPFSGTDDRLAGMGSVTVEDPLQDNWGWSYRLSHTFNRDKSVTDIGASASQFAAERTANSVSLSHAFESKVQGEFFLDSIYDNVSSSIDVGGNRYRHNLELGTLAKAPLGDNLMLEPGIRYLPQYGQLVKAIGFVDQKQQTKTWVTYAEGYRAPALSQLYADSAFYVGNTNLKPEHSQQIEAGFYVKGDKLDTSFVKRSNYGVTVTSIDYADIMQYQSGATKGYWFNQGQASARSFEIAWSQEVGVWTFELQYSYLDTHNTQTDRPLRISPQNQAAAIISHQLGPIIFELRDTYWSKYYNDGYLSGWTELGAWNCTDIGFRTLGFSDWSFRASLENIFDVARELTPFYPEPQRRFSASVERYF